ncbi:MAG: phosphotransferase, partial [Luteitalea sp.]|nr:phosphotransferase [Luteitalea sp.]
MCRLKRAAPSTSASSPMACGSGPVVSTAARSCCAGRMARSSSSRSPWVTMTDRPTPSGVEIGERIDRFLRDQRLDGRSPVVVPLAGDASDRKYFRVMVSGGPSIVLALHAGPIELTTLPFANVADLFGQIPLPVPAILGHADADGILALQDLGDVTLQSHLSGASASERAALYREAVSLIEVLQRRGRELASDRYVPYRTAFDTDKLTWELDFFRRHFVEALRGATLSRSEQDVLTKEWHAIAEELSSEPRVLCHRDYHSRNLMLSGGSLHLIDFQDARLGPDTYDLASLLRDSYVELPDRQIED